MSPKIRVKAKIGELLTQKGIITQQQLAEALALQHTKYKGKLLGEILLAQGIISEEDIYGALATQMGYPYIKLANCLIEPQVLMMIPRKLAEDSFVIAVDKIVNTLTIAMVNPLETEVVEDIEKTSGHKVRVFVTTLSELKEAIKKNYGAERTQKA